MKKKATKTAKKKTLKPKKKQISAKQIAFTKIIFDRAIELGQFTVYTNTEILSFDKGSLAEFAISLGKEFFDFMEFERAKAKGEIK